MFDLGEYDVILGIPFWKFAQCKFEYTTSGITVTGVYKKTKITLPTRSKVESTSQCYIASARDFKKDLEDAEEVYTAYYKGFFPIDETSKGSQLDPEEPRPDLSQAKDIVSATEKKREKRKKPSSPKWNQGISLMNEQLNSEEEITLGNDTERALRKLHFLEKNSHLNDIPRDKSYKELDSLIEKYADVFPEDLPNHLPPQREIDLKIPVKPGHDPPCQAPYRTSDEGQKLIEQTLKYLYDHGFARDSNSEY